MTPLPRVARTRVEAERMLDRLVDEFPDNPAAMSYFYDRFRDPTPPPGPRVGTLCIQVPEELLRAAGLVPVRLCDGFYAHDQIGAELMPAKSCPLVKATLGALQQRAGQGIDWIISPTTCDQKTKAGALIEEMGYRVHTLAMPPEKDSEEARAFWHASVRRLAEALPRMGGRRLTSRALAQAIRSVAAAQAQFRRLQALRREAVVPILGKDVFLVTNAYFFDDLERWTAAVAALNDELERRRAEGFAAAQRRAPRLLFTGSPPIFPNLKLPLLIEQAGGLIVADETCSANRLLHDLAAVDEWHGEDMLEALADRALKPCTCPVYAGNADRRRRLLALARDHAVDGVVYQAFAGCQVYEMEYRSVAKALGEAGLPVLYVETDYAPDDLGQLSTRIEAFLESIKARKRRKAAS
jgi:benzoyl-CoA reductase/2-hydroxyglutaryl-CoA dehydratase subunit BcrC/BadD/HgdB